MTRYVFNRDHSGAPYKGHDEKHARKLLLSEIGNSSKLDDKGQVSWTGLGTIQIEIALRASFVVCYPDGEELNSDDSWRIIWNSLIELIREVGGRKAINPTSLAERANRNAGEFFRKPTTDYVALTSLAIKGFPNKRIRLGNCTLSPFTGARWAYPPAVGFQVPGTKVESHLKSSKYQHWKIATQGRTHEEAVARGLNALHLLRSLWTILSTFRSFRFGSRGIRQRTLGTIHLGPITTLHLPDGKVASDLFWYERTYEGELDLFTPKQGWNYIEDWRIKFQKRLSSLPFKSEIEKLLVRYVGALDNADHDIAFLQMWSLLEKITGTIGKNYDETIKRATWFSADSEFDREILRCIRLQRNQLVHSSASSDDREQLVHMIKAFVEPHLLNLVHNVCKIENVSDYATFLSFPSDLNTLQKRKAQFAQACNIKRPRE